MTYSPPTVDEQRADTRLYERASLINTDAERTVNSAILNDEDARLQAVNEVPPTSFADETQRIVFLALRNLASKDIYLDNLTVASECKRLIKSQKSRAVVTPITIEEIRRSGYLEWEKAIASLARLNFGRAMFDTLNWGVNELSAATDPTEMLDEMRKRIAMIIPPEEDDLIFDGRMLADFEDQDIDQRRADFRAGKTRVVTWPWASWRRNIGTHKPGKLMSMFIPDGEGKSTILQNLVEHLAREWRILYYNLEDPTSNIRHRMGARHTGIPIDKIESGDLTDEEADKLKAAYYRLQPLSDNMKFLNIAGATAEDIKHHAYTDIMYQKAWMEEDPKVIIIIDYYHAMAASRSSLRSNGNTNSAVASDLAGLVGFSGRYRVPIIGSGQVNKEYLKASSMDRERLGRGGAMGTAGYSFNSRIVVMGEQGDGVGVPGFPGTMKYSVVKNNDGIRDAHFEQNFYGAHFLIKDKDEK
jgi:replicative DNA helicase